jgi:hypothetical protein
MRNPFRQDPAAAITFGVDELLRRNATALGHDALFWRAHGSEKLRLWLSIADQYQTATAADRDAIAQFKREISGVSNALEALPTGQENASNPDCIRSLVFSNCIAYDAERHFRSPAEMWETYVKVLEARHLSSWIASVRSGGNGEVSERHLTALESGVALSAALEILGLVATEWRRATAALARPRDREELIEMGRLASAAPARVDASLAGLVAGRPPDVYMDLFEAFVLAVNALMSKWQAELAALSLLVMGNERSAAGKSGEAERSKIEFYRFWRLFQVTYHEMEREHPEAIARLQLDPEARAVINKRDWFDG